MSVAEKVSVNEAVNSIRSTILGLVLIVEASALIVTSGVTIWTALTRPMMRPIEFVALGAASVIAVRGGVLLTKHLRSLGEVNGPKRKVK